MSSLYYKAGYSLLKNKMWKLPKHLNVQNILSVILHDDMFNDILFHFRTKGIV